MKSKLQIPVIPEEEQTAVAKALLGLLEQFAERLQTQDEEIARLKDEISLLKGEKKWPTFKPILIRQSPTKGMLTAVVNVRNGRVRARRRKIASSLSMRPNG
ncbi:MAG: hypothetical protein V2J55_21470 [Candidatus Competibacteraceae bacterium]|nr:hypothetical protein [Candidatus Competibacteraceae bacterium]